MQPDISLSQLVKSLSEPSELLTLGRNWRFAYQKLLTAKLDELLNSGMTSIEDLAVTRQILRPETLGRWLLHPEVAHALLHARHGSDSQLRTLSSTLLLAFRLETPPDSPTNSLLRNIDLDEVLLEHHGIICEATGGLNILPQKGYFSTLTTPKNHIFLSSVIDSTLNRLRDLSLCGYGVVTENTTLLCIREDIENPNSYSSSSYAHYAGLTLLVNIESAHIDEFRLIDSLYHEAIHAVIYFYEELICEMVDTAVNTEQTIRSPWSGNTLGVSQYIQACFVWWGLLNFWTTLRVNSNILGSSEWLEHRARKGFELNPSTILHENKVALRSVSSDASAAISIIQSDFISRFQNSGS